MRRLPFYGKGTAFPFRVNPATGGTVVTEAIQESVSVALAYLNEAWTIREDTTHPQNHIAEAIAHILLTNQREHDTLPEFGSRIRDILFELNHQQIHNLLKIFFEESTIRWEKRGRFPKDAVQFTPRGYTIDQGILPATAYVEFIAQQVAGNLVAPFVNPRQARTQEYSAGKIDEGGHDYQSRYYEKSRYEHNGCTFTRFPRRRPAEVNQDDQFHKIRPGDTWLLISWDYYHDIRFWPYIARMHAFDSSEEGESRHSMDPSQEPEIGTIIRIPSKARLLRQIAGAA